MCSLHSPSCAGYKFLLRSLMKPCGSATNRGRCVGGGGGCALGKSRWREDCDWSDPGEGCCPRLQWRMRESQGSCSPNDSLLGIVKCTAHVTCTPVHVLFLLSFLRREAKIRCFLHGHWCQCLSNVPAPFPQEWAKACLPLTLPGGMSQGLPRLPVLCWPWAGGARVASCLAPGIHAEVFSGGEFAHRSRSCCWKMTGSVGSSRCDTVVWFASSWPGPRNLGETLQLFPRGFFF